jgi:hypothetical protein
LFEFNEWKIVYYFPENIWLLKRKHKKTTRYTLLRYNLEEYKQKK